MSAPLSPTVLKNRPLGKQDSNHIIIPDSFNDESFLGDYVGGTNLIYKGFARPGASSAAAVWQISKQTYDGNDNITAIQWPQDLNGNASNDYEFIWDNRASLTYV